MARLDDRIEIANPQQPHCATVLLLDTSGSMSSRIPELQEGIKDFLDDIMEDDLAKKRIDLAVVTFGEQAAVAHEFSSPADFSPPALIAEGRTPMGEAILKAIDILEERKRQYKAMGTDYFRPWIFMFTDGEPTDMQPGDTKWNEVTKKVHEGEAQKRFMFFAVGTREANMDILRQIAPSNRGPVRFKEGKFRELFQWLSKSQAKVSASKVGEQVALDNPVAAGWAEIGT